MRVYFDDEITEEQVRRVDEAMREEFSSGEWVAVEGEGWN